MPNYLIEDKFNLQGLNISYKVTGKTPSGSNPIFILVAGSLNYASKLLRQFARDYDELKKKNNLPDVNFIFFDFPGSGKSDKSTNPQTHYTIPFFSEVAARTVEAVRQKLHLDKMQLFVHGGNHGGLVTMNLPHIRKEWLEESSPIRLRLIFNLSSPNNFAGITSTAFLEQSHKNDPNLPQYLEAMAKVKYGEIKNRDDQIKNVQLKIAPLYFDTEEFRYKFLKSIMDFKPGIGINLLKALRAISPSEALKNEYSSVIEMLSGCAIDVWNQLAKSQFDGFDVEKIIAANPDIYAKIPIICIDPSSEVLGPDPKSNAQRLSTLTSGNIAEITMKGDLSQLESQYASLMNKLYSGQLNEAFIKEQGANIVSFSMRPEFIKQYKQVQLDVLQPESVPLKSTTAQSLGVMGYDTRAGVKKTKPRTENSKAKDELVQRPVDEERPQPRPDYNHIYGEALRGVHF